MNAKLLELDGVGNVLLGLPLLLFPEAVSGFLGLPAIAATFYPAILGAVFVGIGAALLLERFRPALGGLGLGGAMAINLIFGVVLAGWLLLSEVSLPTRGLVALSMLAVILVGISLAEALSLSRKGAGLSRSGGEYQAPRCDLHVLASTYATAYLAAGAACLVRYVQMEAWSAA